MSYLTRADTALAFAKSAGWQYRETVQGDLRFCSFFDGQITITIPPPTAPFREHLLLIGRIAENLCPGETTKQVEFAIRVLRLVPPGGDLAWAALEAAFRR